MHYCISLFFIVKFLRHLHVNSCVLYVFLLFNFCLFTIIDLSPGVLFARQVVSEPMVVCGEGGEVFMVPTQQGQRKPKQSTHKDPEKKKKIYIYIYIANGAK